MTKSGNIRLLGAFSFDLKNETLCSDTGEPAELRPQTKRVLAVLAKRSNTIVSKQELMDEVWADISVTDDSLVQCVSEIRKALGPTDSGLLQTIPRKGYRLIVQNASRTGRPVLSTRGAMTVGVVLFLVAAIWAGMFGLPFGRPQEQASPITIAVLPFRNMSGDPEQNYLSNGVAEDLIVSLSGLSDLRVLARGTTFAFADGDKDLRELAAALGSDYVVEGSLWRLGDTVKLSTALVEGDSGAVVWAKQFEGASSEILGFQDEVLNELIRVLSIRLSDNERQRLGIAGTKNAAAYDAYLKGRELENFYTADSNRAAEIALLDAIRQDQGFALAHAHVAQVYSFRVENRWSNAPQADIRRAFAAAETAVKIDPDLPFAQFSLGRLYTRSFAPDLAKATEHYRRAIELDPNYVDAYVFLANVHVFNGDAAKALPLISSGFERNPTPPYWYHHARGMAHYFLGNYGEAETALKIARDQNPTAPFPYRFLIATYGMTGNQDEADWMAMEYEALGRAANIKALLETASTQNPEYRELFEEGFRRAGLAEE